MKTRVLPPTPPHLILKFYIILFMDILIKMMRKKNRNVFYTEKLRNFHYFTKNLFSIMYFFSELIQLKISEKIKFYITNFQRIHDWKKLVSSNGHTHTKNLTHKSPHSIPSHPPPHFPLATIYILNTYTHTKIYICIKTKQDISTTN